MIVISLNVATVKVIDEITRDSLQLILLVSIPIPLEISVLGQPFSKFVKENSMAFHEIPVLVV